MASRQPQHRNRRPRTPPGELAGLAQLVAHLSTRHRGTAQALPTSIESALPLHLVRRHLLAPLAYRAGVAVFRKDFIASALLAEVRARTLHDVVSALDRLAIPVILFKGISYSRSIYGDAAERPMSDIDLMVPAIAHADAARVLRRLGYWEAGSLRQASRFHHAVCFKRKDAAIDLHRSVMQPYRSRIDMADLWKQASPATEHAHHTYGSNLRRFAPVDEAVLHLAHIARHELRVPCINYVDAARLLDEIPDGRERVLARARAFRIRRGVAAAIAMTELLAKPRPGPPVTVAPHLPDIYGKRMDVLAWRQLLPGVAEVLLDRPLSRTTQLMRKVALVDGPRELAGLLLVGVHAKLAHLHRA